MESTMVRQTFQIEGMTCAGCVRSVEKALESVEGVHRADVNLATAEATVEGEQFDVDALLRSVQQAGYHAEPYASKESDPESSGDEQETDSYQAVISQLHDRLNRSSVESSEFRNRFWVALPLAAIVMVIEMGPMITGGSWMQWTHDNLFVINMVKLMLTAVILFYSGSSFFSRAWKATLRRTADMNTLVAVGTGSAFLFSSWAVFFGQDGAMVTPHDVYFDTAAVIIALVLLGRWMEDRARNSTRDTLRGLLELSPKMAHKILENGDVISVPLKQVHKGDTLLVKAYESIPVDGMISEGSASIDESMMTGESMPVFRDKGDPVTGGTRNTSSTFRMTATKVGSDTALAGIIESVRKAQGSKAPIQRMVDKVSSVFVPIVMVIALLTFVLWWVFGTPQQALVNMVAVLVIACPCALGLATPTAIMVGSGTAAGKGILIKDAVTLEEARNVDTMIFDKTGTLTTGDMDIIVIQTLTDLNETDIVKFAVSIEQGSDHPIAKSIVKLATSREIKPLNGLQIETRAGVGISGIVDGRVVEIGSVKLVPESLKPELQPQIVHHQNNGHIVLVMLVDKQPSALIVLEDELRKEAGSVVNQLMKAGIEVVMVTGDQENAARAVADKLGIQRLESGVSPTGKSDIISKYQAEGRKVAMTGDGINDAAALTQSDLGIAMSGGSDLAVSSADITILGNNLHLVPESLSLSKKVLKVIRQNLFWAFVYNTIGIPLAALGFLSPMIAGAAMAFSSVSVVANSLRIRRM